MAKTIILAEVNCDADSIEDAFDIEFQEFKKQVDKIEIEYSAESLGLELGLTLEAILRAIAEQLTEIISKGFSSEINVSKIIVAIWKRKHRKKIVLKEAIGTFILIRVALKGLAGAVVTYPLPSLAPYNFHHN